MSNAKRNNRNRKVTVFTVTIAIVVIATLLYKSYVGTERTAESFCRVLSEEKTRLATFPGDAYPSGIFNEELSNAQEFVNSFAKLEKVAPDEIMADVSTLKSLYAKIQSDPSQAIVAGLSGIEPEDNVKSWIKMNCR